MRSISACRSASALLSVLLFTTASLAQHIILPAPPEVQPSNQPATASAAQPESLALAKKDALKPQTLSVPSPADPHHGNYFTHLLHEQKEIWTSPFKLKSSDAKWLAPLVVTTAALMATDKSASRKLPKGEETLEVSSQISRLGEGYTTFAAAGLAYTLGRFSRNERLQETGRLGFEALINTSIVVGGLKYALGRKRPTAVTDGGEFFQGGKAFPSGHSATCWALATVIAEEYNDKPWVRFAAYGLASAVSISRFTGQKHFSSDVFVGSTIGYLIGHYTVKKFASNRKKNLVPVIAPQISQATRSYGLSASVSF